MWINNINNENYGIWDEEAYPFILPLPWWTTIITVNQWTDLEDRWITDSSSFNTVDYTVEYWLWAEEAYPFLLISPWIETNTSIDVNQWITFEERDEYEVVYDNNFNEISIDWYIDYCTGNLFVII